MTIQSIDPRTRALVALADAVAEIVEAGGELGVPGGTLYAALMTYGCTLEQFEGLMRALVATRRVVRRGDLYVRRG